MIKYNIDKTADELYKKGKEGAKALNEIRRRTFEVFRGVANGRVSVEEASEAAWKFAENPIKANLVTKEQVEEVIFNAAKNAVTYYENKGSAKGR